MKEVLLLFLIRELATPLLNVLSVEQLVPWNSLIPRAVSAGKQASWEHIIASCNNSGDLGRDALCYGI